MTEGDIGRVEAAVRRGDIPAALAEVALVLARQIDAGPDIDLTPIVIKAAQELRVTLMALMKADDDDDDDDEAARLPAPVRNIEDAGTVDPGRAGRKGRRAAG